MSRFGMEPLTFFNSVYEGAAPWDIGTPQPTMIALLGKFPPTAPILDLGCGSGDLAIYLAQQGHEVVGIDFVEAAVEKAQARLDALPLQTAQLLRFQVADALKPMLLQQKFGAVVDSGFYHLFNPEQGELLANEVAAILLPGGRYYLHEFAIEFPIPNMPRQITAEELEARFTAAKGWHIQQIQAAEFLNRVGPPVPAIAACIGWFPS